MSWIYPKAMLQGRISVLGISEIFQGYVFRAEFQGCIQGQYQMLGGVRVSVCVTSDFRISFQLR